MTRLWTIAGSAKAAVPDVGILAASSSDPHRRWRGSLVANPRHLFCVVRQGRPWRHGAFATSFCVMSRVGRRDLLVRSWVSFRLSFRALGPHRPRLGRRRSRPISALTRRFPTRRRIRSSSGSPCPCPGRRRSQPSLGTTHYRRRSGLRLVLATKGREASLFRQRLFLNLGVDTAFFGATSTSPRQEGEPAFCGTVSFSTFFP